jgi:hypothetical protein
MEHPDGTVAEFKHYYEHEISDEVKKVSIYCFILSRSGLIDGTPIPEYVIYYRSEGY